MEQEPKMEYYRILENVCDHYETLFKELELRFEGAEFKKQEEALVWEQQGCKLILFLLHSLNVPYDMDIEDIRPQVATTTGKKAEIDFRIKIHGNYTYFGVTHFHSRSFERDSIVIDEPVNDLKEEIYRGEKLVETIYHGEAKLIRRRRQTDYLNKRIVTRLATEGQNSFPCDYVYVLYPKNDQGFGGGLDGISASFEFGSGYEYRETGITGVMLVGKKVQVDGKYMRVRDDQWMLRTMSFDRCSSTIRNILGRLDKNTIDLRGHLEQIRNHLEALGINPKTFAEFNDL